MEFRRFLAAHLAAMIAPAGWRLAALLFVVAMAARAQTFANPVIGFDEQFYLVVGERMLGGALPFVDIFDRKPIGLFLLYAAAAALPGDATLGYQALALVFAASTAWLIAAVARRSAPPWGALAAAVAYLLWLDLAEGEGGQSPVFYNLPMAASGLIVARAVGARAAEAGAGAAAMLLVGLAMQIKYSAVFEGVFFGCALLWAAWRGGAAPAALAARAAVWIAAALAPTLAAAGAYAAMGHGEAWWFANIAAQGGTLADPAATMLSGLAVIVAVVAPLALMVALGPRAPGFALGWLAASATGMLAFGAFASPHYALPLFVPLAIAAAPGFAARRAAAIAVLALGLVAGQAALAVTRHAKGGGPEARALAAAAQPRAGGCLWVHDGYPALYRLTRTCLPSRYVFPGHLNTAAEASAAALGVDPQAEVARILAARPETIVTHRPPFARGNAKTQARLEVALARDYTLVAEVVTGGTRRRQVYRLRGS